MRKFILSSMMMAAMSMFVQEGNCWGPFKKKAAATAETTQVAAPAKAESQGVQELVDFSQTLQEFKKNTAEQQKIHKAVIKFIDDVMGTLQREKDGAFHKNDVGKLRRQVDNFAGLVSDFRGIELNHDDIDAVLENFKKALSAYVTANHGGDANKREKSDLAKDIVSKLGEGEAE